MALMAEKEKAELRFYQKTWFNIPLIIGSVVVALALRRLGLFEEDGGLFTLSAIAFALFAVCTLPFPAALSVDASPDADRVQAG